MRCYKNLDCGNCAKNLNFASCMSKNFAENMSEIKVTINKKLKGLPREELALFSKEELIDKIVQLEAYNFQLKNILQKKLDSEERKQPGCVRLMEELNNKGNDFNAATGLPTVKSEFIKLNAISKKEKGKKFDFSRTHKRHVLLRLLYFGWDYQGFACQEDSNATIEYHLFRALTRACLIESRATSNYHRCGRTDKEVSAFCQVVSIDLRSKFPVEQQLLPESLAAEIDYCGILNRILPKNIQCIAWMPLKNPEYSARFDCNTRTYRYYFPQGDLNIEAMRTACKLLERHADFRNFCKMDVHNGVTNYTRSIKAANIHICTDEREDGTGYSMHYLEIKANAFLWHQIRCIMAVLLLIGQGKEEPKVVSELLDVETNPCKPQYTPAVGLPLNLFECEFLKRSTRRNNPSHSKMDAGVHEEPAPEVKLKLDSAADSESDTTAWIYNDQNLRKLIETTQSEWTRFNVKSTMIRNVLHNLEQTLNSQFKSQQVRSQVLLLQDFARSRQYQKLLNRKRCESLENRIQHFVKKQRLIIKPGESVEMPGGTSTERK